MGKRAKVSVIGGGFVGSTCAHWIAAKELADVALIDINEGAAAGKALDLFEASPVEGFDAKIKGGADYALTEGSEVVVITAGIPRKPGMSRDDLLKTNAGIVSECARQVVKYSPNTTIIVVSNPLDAMCSVVQDVTKLPANKIIGMAGVLDSARYRSFIAEELDVSVEDVHGFVYGGHGDTMVPLPRYTTVGGLPLSVFMSDDKIAKIVDRAKNGGAEIVNLLKTGSAYYAPSSSAVAMVEAIVKDKKRILPCAVHLNGEYGVKGYFIGVLCKLGKDGVEKIIEIELNAQEKDMFQKSVQAVKTLVDDMRKMLQQ